jgi:flagellin
MTSVINTNINTLTAQRNLAMSQLSLQTSMQRLSSGLRINSAKDDAAGLAIADRMTSQIRGLNQASRNANDAISLAQTAEGALGSISDNLQRMRELAVQAANGTLSAPDRAAVQSEVSQLKSEIDRVGNQTSFNGTKLLDGANGGFSFQVGADSNQTISITSLTDVRAANLGTSTYAAADGTAIVPTPAGTDLSALDGATAGKSLLVGGFQVGGKTITGTDFSVADTALVTVTEYSQWMQKTVDAVNAQSADTGVTAGLKYDSTAKSYTISFQAVLVSASQSGNVDFVAGATNTGALLGINVIDSSTAAKGKSVTQTGIANIDVGSVSGANQAMIMLDGALKSINSIRGDLGAIQNRFSSTVANLQTTSENLSSSRSRIQDADFAQETANLSRSQILQQAGTAMVAQANALPQGVLALLR